MGWTGISHWQETSQALQGKSRKFSQTKTPSSLEVTLENESWKFVLTPLNSTWLLAWTVNINFSVAGISWAQGFVILLNHAFPSTQLGEKSLNLGPKRSLMIPTLVNMVHLTQLIYWAADILKDSGSLTLVKIDYWGLGSVWFGLSCWSTALNVDNCTAVLCSIVAIICCTV